MRKQITLRIILVLIVLIFAMLPVAALAEGVYVHAESPGYDIVVGKDVTFKWYDTVTRKQRSFAVFANGMTASGNGSWQEVPWPNFPFGTGYWDVTIYNCKNQRCWIGRTNRQNFYHYNNIPNTTNYRPEPFEYKRGFRSPRTLSDYTVFFELTKDYRIDIANYFEKLEKLPEPIDWDDEYEKTELHRQDLYDHAKALPNMESDFLKLDGGVLTIKQGYRWDGTSNPGVGEEESSDLRSSCVHDALYDLIRMEYLARDEENHFNWVWNEAGYMNRLVVDTMHFLIAVEDKNKSVTDARSDWRTLRKLARANTGYDYLLRAFKYHVSELTAWVTDDGKVDLHWMPANKTDEPNKVDDDPKNYRNRPHNYDIYRTTSNSSNWSHIGSKTFYPADMNDHNDATVYFTDPDVISGEIYYYWIRANDPDYDGDGWTDQEEDDYANGNWKRDWIHPNYRKRHYDESVVEAVVPAIGPGNALQLNGVDQYVISTSEPGINSGDSWTFEAWVYPEDGDNFGTILHSSDLFNTNYNSLVYSNQTDQFCYSKWSVIDPNLPDHCSEEGLITPGHWYHLAVTINDSEIVLYVDGVPEVNITPLFDYPETTPTFSIGADCNMNKWWDPEGGDYETGAFAYKNILTDFFKGKIDELRVWSVARTEKEIRDNMSVPLRGDHEDLVALWHFDEPDGTHTAYDATINGRDGEIHEARFMNKNNVAPTASIDSVDQPNPHFILPVVHTLTFNGSFTDPGWLNAHTSNWDFGDGANDPGILTEENDPPDATGTTTAQYAYPEPGTYLVTLTVTDDDGDTGTDTTSVTVMTGEDAIEIIADYINNLPNSAFRKKPAKRKRVLLKKLRAVNLSPNAQTLQAAISKLHHDIRAKTDGSLNGKRKNDWIKDPQAQYDICWMIDDLIAYLQAKQLSQPG